MRSVEFGLRVRLGMNFTFPVSGMIYDRFQSKEERVRYRHSIKCLLLMEAICLTISECEAVQSLRLPEN